MTPYVKLARRFFEHPFWTRRRVFSQAEAWLDLLSEAAFKPHAMAYGNRILQLRRGEVPHSVRTLAQRWGWSKSAVARFVSVLKAKRMVGRRAEQGVQLLVIVNYETYQDAPREAGQQAGQQAGHERDSSGTNRIKGNKETTPPTPPAPVSGGVVGVVDFEEYLRQFPQVAERYTADRLAQELATDNGQTAMVLAALSETVTLPDAHSPIALARHRAANDRVPPLVLRRVQRAIGEIQPRPPAEPMDEADAQERVRQQIEAARGLDLDLIRQAKERCR